MRILSRSLDTAGDYQQCQFDVFLGQDKVFCLVQGITGTAAALAFGGRDKAATLAFQRGLQRTHGLIDVSGYELGQTVSHWITSNDTKVNQEITDARIRLTLLKALYQGMRQNPSGFKYERTDVDGFCEALGIPRKTFEFNATVLFEQSLVQRTPGDQYSLKDGALRISPKGVELIEKSPNPHEIEGDRISVLFLAADPTDASRLRLGEELREVQEKLQIAKLRDRFQLDQRMSVRPADVSQALLDVRPKIVHFSGHGTTGGELCFEDHSGRTHPVTPDALAALFEQFAHQVRCVILNACYSEIQANAIAKHIDFVVGMNQAIGDKAAIAFSVGFYQALGAGLEIVAAYKLGCVQIRLQGASEALTPVLVQRQ